MELNLKQRYLQANLPNPVVFDQQRARNFQKLLVLISTTDRTKWLSTGFNIGALIQGYKQVYGLTSQQFETLITLLSNIALKEQGLSTETRVLILRLLNALTEYQIKITDNFRISNRKLLQLLDTLANEGIDGTLRNADAVVEQISKYILYFSRFGEEVVEEALGLSVEYNDIRYLVIFLRSLKTEAAALKLLGELFSDNNLWDRDCFWFYILSEIIKKFPKLDYSSYYQTIMQEVIRAFTTIIEGSNEEGLKKLTATDPFLLIQPVLKSVALAMVYLLLPASQPQHSFIKSCIQRLFCLVTSSLDHINPPEYLGDLLGFVKIFVAAYLQRYRAERGVYLLSNEDEINDSSRESQKELLIDQSCEEFFDSLWGDIIGKVIYLEDAQECKPSKIISELCIYKPEKFLKISLDAILDVVGREDPTLISLHGAKITILFLQEFIIIDHPQYLEAYIQCCSFMSSAMEKLGIAENLDILELIFRSFLYLNEEQIANDAVQELVEESLTLMIGNMEAMSMGLQGSEGEQAELYMDLGNIYLPFLLRLSPQQITIFSEKFLFHLVSQIPEHQEAFEMIAVGLCYIDPTFTKKIFKYIEKELINEDVVVNEQEEVVTEWEFLKPVTGEIHARNEQALKWYTSLLQSIFQYHPQNVITFWPDIEQIINLLIVEWDEQSYLEIALDIIYNLLLCLLKPHLPWSQFVKSANADYRTLHLNWQPISPEVKKLIDQIFDKYFVDISHYLRREYNQELLINQKDVTILADFQTYIERVQNSDTLRIRRRNLRLVDYVLLPQLTDPEDAEDRRIIYRALSVQYTVLSALMLRVPFHSGLENNGDFFTEQRYCNLRPNTCQYLQWVMQLLGRFDLMSEQPFIKLFNFFWRESHDEVSYTASIAATNEKLEPFYFPQQHRKKELLRSPFLVVNQAYLCHMVRLQFHLIVAPTAHLNNPRYLESNFILGLNPLYEPGLHSYFPTYVSVHQYHRELMAICRFHLDPNNPEGYLARLGLEEDPATKERLLSAVKSLILGIKRLLNVFSDNCCMQDEFVRNTIFQLVNLYRVLPKKTDKALIYEIIYVLLVFSYDPLCLGQTPEYSLSRYWTLRLQNDPQIAEYQIVSIKETPSLPRIIAELEREEMQFLEQVTAVQGLRLTRSCSVELDSDLPKQLQRAVNYLMKKIEEGLPTLERDLGVYLLMVLLYSNSLPLTHPSIASLTKLLFKLTQSDSIELFQMSKTGLFHIVNRFNHNQKSEIKFANTPLKRPWDDFLTYKYLGGENINYENIKCEKNEEIFYPSKELVEYRYRQLGSDPSVPTYYNELALLEVLSNEEGLLKFIRKCTTDPDLKQGDGYVQESMTVSEDDFKSISASAHKLMHFIWDCNPSKTPLFMGLLERYASSPLNYYNRFFRKSIRIVSEDTRMMFNRVAQKLREGEPEEIRLSFYINCELMLRNPTDSQHLQFLTYMEECSKENFDFVLMGFYGVFTSNFVSARKNYDVLLAKLRSLKGAARLRHLDLLNTYMIAQGRFARSAAREGAEHLLRGISEGSDEISQTVVNMITECFVQVINLKEVKDWVDESLEELVDTRKIYLLNENVGYNNENLLVLLLTELMKKARDQQSLQSSKLRIYSQIVRKVIASITIYRFNDYFFNLLKDLIVYVLERPAPAQGEEDAAAADQYVIAQLCGSEYPEDIYQQLLQVVVPMTDCTPYVVRKKLTFFEGLVIHRSFRLNEVQFPPLLQTNEKIVTLDYITTIATIARLMKAEEMTEYAERILAQDHREKHKTYMLIALLMATGVREFDWKERVIRDLIKHKKNKLVKEAISSWWKGKTPESDQEKRIAELVRNFQNPYSYFA